MDIFIYRPDLKTLSDVDLNLDHLYHFPTGKPIKRLMYEREEEYRYKLEKQKQENMKTRFVTVPER